MGRGRALVLMQLGQMEEAYEGFNFVLESRPNGAVSRYGRGLAMLWINEQVAGPPQVPVTAADLAAARADLAAAVVADAEVAIRFESWGLILPGDESAEPAPAAP